MPLADLRRHRLDRGAERVEAVDPLRAEVDVVQILGEDRAQQRREQRDVGAGDELEVKVGVGGDLGATRIDDDELQAALPRLLEPAQPVVHREAGEIAALHRHQRIRSREEPHVGVFEPLATGRPAFRGARCATHFADWSIVIVEKRLCEPTARSHAPAKLNVSDAV